MGFDVRAWMSAAAWRSDLTALLAGAGTLLGFAPFGLGLLPLFTLAVLFWLWLDQTPGRAFRSGWLFGLGLMAFGLYWVKLSVCVASAGACEQSGAFELLAIVIAAGFVLLISLFHGLAGWLARKLLDWFGTSRTAVDAGIPLLVVFPAIWVLLEWLRGWILTGFPWLSLGYSQIDLPSAGLATALGVYGLSWLVAFAAGLLLLARRIWPLVLLVALGASGWALGQLSWTEPAGEPFQASLVQGNFEQKTKWQRKMLLPTIERYLDLTAQVPASRLVIWPETAMPTFDTRVEDGLLRPLHAEGVQLGRDLLLGIPVLEADGRYFNAMINLGQSGRSVYYKRHLVPFGEYLPLKDLLQPFIDLFELPMSDFSPGDAERPLLRLAGHAVGISICYEDAFGAETIQALPEAAFLINTSNDAWFGDSVAPPQHLEIARMRALETGRFLLRATNTGLTAIIGPKGELVDLAPQFEVAVLTGEVQPLRGLTPFARWGNWPIVGLLMLSLALLGVHGWRSGAAPSTSSC